MTDVANADLEARLYALAAVAANGWSIEQRVQLAAAAMCHYSSYAERLDVACQVSKLYASNVSMPLLYVKAIVTLPQTARKDLLEFKGVGALATIMAEMRSAGGRMLRMQISQPSC